MTTKKNAGARLRGLISDYTNTLTESSKKTRMKLSEAPMTVSVDSVSPEAVEIINTLIDTGIASGDDLRAVLELLNVAWQSAERRQGPAHAEHYVSRARGSRDRFAAKQAELDAASKELESIAQANTVALKSVLPVKQWERIVRDYSAKVGQGIETASLESSVVAILGVANTQLYARRAGLDPYNMNLSPVTA